MPQPSPSRSGHLIVAHRGLHDRFPENSLAAMTAAWDAQIPWCECDVQLNSDEIPFVIHDDTLDRTTTGHGRVDQTPASVLQTLRLRDAAGAPTDHPLPTLDQLLELTSPSRRLLVETKPHLGPRMDAIARRIHSHGGMLHSFHLDDLFSALRATNNACSVALLVDKDQALPDDFPGAFHVHYDVVQQGSHPPTLGVWTVNEPDQIRRILKFNLAMIITDNPLQALQILADPNPQQT